MQAILDSMAWLGLDYDEGPIYQIAADGSLSRQWSPRCSLAGTAYHCYATAEELDALARGAARPR